MVVIGGRAPLRILANLCGRAGWWRAGAFRCAGAVQREVCGVGWWWDLWNLFAIDLDGV